MFEKIIELIGQYDKIIIHRHKRPDGDAIGSQVGLKNLIKENFPEKTVYAVGDPAGRYAFVEDSTTDELTDADFEGALSIILDTSAASLISDDRYTLADKTARIDHHIFVEKIADVEVTDTSYESCCGLITELAREQGLRLNATAAKALYTGMVTDSGRFRYDSTTPKTHILAAHLLSVGFSTADIFRNLYSDDFSFIKLRASFVLKIQFTEKNVAYIYTTKEEVDSYGVDTFTISRGMVNVMGEIRGVDIWVNFTETENGVLAELRSSRYNVNKIAVKYGGGGHEKASGATLADRRAAMAMLADLDAIMEGKTE
nr:bifunctional oligoribonuclease/PAP phosphatase NrnA [Clostridia bacterium]